MKRRRILRYLLCLVAALALAIFIWPREREPEYNGATLSTWLGRVSTSTNQIQLLEASNAVRHIGTNALPFLIRWIQHEPGWRDAVGQRILQWPLFRNSRDVQQLIRNMTGYRADCAVPGFQVLGYEATSAIPELTRLSEDTRAPETMRRATDCLILTLKPPPLDFDNVPSSFRRAPL
jgi:hypothetical protein